MSTQRLDPTHTIRRDITRVTPELCSSAAEFPTATLHEAAGKTGALPWAIKPVAPSFRMCGPAITVHAPRGDNLWLHRALYVAEPGDVLVVHVGGAYDHGYWGEIMSTAARVRGLAGLMIDGCVRDAVLLADIGFPVFARGLCIRGTGKDFAARGWINSPTLFDDVVVAPGDLIVGDGDGVVCISRERVGSVLQEAHTRAEVETQILQRLNNGESTLQLYGWE